MNLTNPAAAETPAPAAGGFHPLQVLLRRRWQLLAALLIISSIALAATILRRDRYEAIARVQVVMDQPKLGNLTALAGSSDYFTTQCQLLRSRHVMTRAAERLNAAGGHWTLDDLGLRKLYDSVKVKPVAGSRLIDIIGVSESPDQAAAIANQITAAFIETSTEARKAANDRILERIDLQIANYDKEILALEDSLSKFRQENVITSNTAGTDLQDRITQMERQLTQVKLDRITQENRRDQLQNLLKSGKLLTANLPELDNKTELASLRQKLSSLEQEQSKLAQAYLPGHQKLQGISQEITDLRGQLARQKSDLLQQLHNESAQQCQIIAGQETSLSQLVSAQKETAIKLAQSGLEHQKLLASLELARKFKSESLARTKQFTLEEGLSESPVAVVDAANTPSGIAGLSRPQQAASILLLGLIFSISFIFALERFSMPARTAAAPAPAYPVYIPMNSPGMAWPDAPQSAPAPESEILKDSLRLGQLGLMKFSGEGERGFAARAQITQLDAAGTEASVVREITTRLLGRFGRTHQALVVTGPQGGGKTTLAANLAIALAQSGRKVALVDADLHQPDLAKVFKADEDRPQLQTLLSEPACLEEALQPTDWPTLRVIHAGANTPANFENHGLVELEMELLRRFDWVIYDAASSRDRLTDGLLQTVGKALCVCPAAPDDNWKSHVEQAELSGAVCVGWIENNLDPALAAAAR